MKNNIKKHIKPIRLEGLPDLMRQTLKNARLARHMSQAALGEVLGLPQMHISGIETGKIVPRFDTLLDFVRVLGFDLLLVPYPIVPYTKALIRDLNHPSGELRSMYADNDDDTSEDEAFHDEI